MRTSILLMTVASLAITPVVAQENVERQDTGEVEQGRELPMQGNRQRLEIGSADSEVVQADVGEWVSVNGRIQDVYDDSFILDYGGGDVTVDMRDGYRDAFPLEIGENVTVSGRIDDGFFDRRSIEAESVHSARLAQRYMVENSEMDEAFFEQPEERLAMDDEWLTVSGTIVSVDGDEMTLDVGTQIVSVDLDRMDGELTAQPGDRVSVYGEMDDADFWEGREIVAQTVTPLNSVAEASREQQQKRDAAREPQTTAQDARPNSEIESSDAEIAQAQNYEWVTVSGRIQEVYADGFVLDYGGGDIRVEMDDYDGVSRTSGLEENQHVMVSGQIDDDMFESRTLEARWVYDSGTQKYRFANSMDEEDHLFDYPDSMLAADDEWLSVTGRIVSMIGDRMTLDIGNEYLAVDLDRLEGEIEAEAGDRVSVYGEMDDADFWEGREIIAQSVTPLADDEG